MAQYGLGNFLYELEVSNGNANFRFFDPEDSTNTAEVSVAKKDFPEGVVQADARQVADVAFSLCQKTLNDKRDARLENEAAKREADQKDREQTAREAAADFFDKSQEGSVAPAKVESDGTTVYNTETPKDNGKKK